MIENQVAVLDEVEVAPPEIEAPEVEVSAETGNGSLSSNDECCDRSSSFRCSSAAAAGEASQPARTPGSTRSRRTHAPRRLIVPQTGPRPVYLAPPSAARPTANGAPRVEACRSVANQFSSARVRGPRRRVRRARRRVRASAAGHIPRVPARRAPVQDLDPAQVLRRRPPDNVRPAARCGPGSATFPAG